MKKEKDIHDWGIARNKELRGAEKIKDPHERIEKVNEIVRRYKETADKNWIISEQYAAQIKVGAEREIWRTEDKQEKSLEEQVLEYIKTKGATPLISGEWLSKQEKLGRTFLQLKPQIDNLIEDSLEMEKAVKEAESKMEASKQW